MKPSTLGLPSNVNRMALGMAAMMNLFMGHHEETQVALHLLVSHALYAEIFQIQTKTKCRLNFPASIRCGLMYCSTEPRHRSKVQREHADKDSTPEVRLPGRPLGDGTCVASP